MPIIHHKKPPETPWRPNYHGWDITRPGDGTTNSSLSYSEVGIGAGPPLHTHESDELIVVLEGTLEARLGDEISMVGADHTVGVPPNVPHSFKNAGPVVARILGVFPVNDPFDHTEYQEGAPPDIHGE